MLSRIATVLGLTIVFGAPGSLLGGTIPCDNSTPNECMSAPTCQTNGTCRGEPIREGEPCAQDTSSGGCMGNPAFCRNGACVGTVPQPTGTECTFAGLEKCYSPGHCQSIPVAQISFCTLGQMKTCQQPADPCKVAACNGQTGECVVGDRCFTFSGCEVCEGSGMCRPANTGGACTNPEGDFNPCTTNDRCTVIGTSSLPEFSPATGSALPTGVAAALDAARQVGGSRSYCLGVAGGGPTPTVTPPTGPTVTPTGEATACTGDCGGGGSVTVSKVVTMVNIALGSADVSACPQGDPDKSGDIKITEIVTAVRNSLIGCS